MPTSCVRVGGALACGQADASPRRTQGSITIMANFVQESGVCSACGEEQRAKNCAQHVLRLDATCFLRLVADNRPNKDLLVRHSRSVERSRSVRPSLQRALDQRPGLLQWAAREARRRMRVQASRRLSSRHP
eukprot:3041449-Rhodomonas_salina.2